MNWSTPFYGVGESVSIISLPLYVNVSQSFVAGRPIVLPLYMSSSAFNFVSMTSYTNFCFMRRIRHSAFSGENGSVRDGIAETFWFYSQNLPTVALLLPRAGLCLALLFAFSSPQPSYVSLVDAGFSRRDDTFFREDNGT